MIELFTARDSQARRQGDNSRSPSLATTGKIHTREVDHEEQTTEIFHGRAQRIL